MLAKFHDSAHKPSAWEFGSRWNLKMMEMFLAAFMLVILTTVTQAASSGASFNVSQYLGSNKVDSSNLQIYPGSGFILKIQSPKTSVAGRFNFNQIIAHINVPVTGGSAETVPCACVDAFHVVLLVGPRYHGREAYGGGFGLSTTDDSPDEVSDLVGLSSGVKQDHDWRNARAYGASSGATLGANGFAKQLIGIETDVVLNTSIGTSYRSGFQAWGGGSHRASIVDSAFTVECSGGASNSGGCWKSVLALQDFGGKLNPPLSSDSSMFVSENALTVRNVFDMVSVTVTENILRFPNAVLSGAGDFTLSTLRLNKQVDPFSVPKGHLAVGSTLDTNIAKCGSLAGTKTCWTVYIGNGSGGVAHYIPLF